MPRAVNLPDFTIRTAVREDEEAITKFCLKGALETLNRTLDPVEVRGGVSHVLRGHSDFYVVAKSGSEYVGQLKVHQHDYDWYDAVFWWIEHVYVVPHYRRKGIAQAMLDFGVELANQNGYVKHLLLHVGEKNERAIMTYESFGFNRAELRMMIFSEGLIYNEKRKK